MTRRKTRRTANAKANLTEGAGIVSSAGVRAEGAEIAEERSCQFRHSFDSVGTDGRGSDRYIRAPIGAATGVPSGSGAVGGLTNLAALPPYFFTATV